MPDIDEVLNPHRAEEQARARQHALDLLERRGVRLTGGETDDELANLCRQSSDSRIRWRPAAAIP